jgi:hypothetical protein
LHVARGIIKPSTLGVAAGRSIPTSAISAEESSAVAAVAPRAAAARDGAIAGNHHLVERDRTAGNIHGAAHSGACGAAIATGAGFCHDISVQQ